MSIFKIFKKKTSSRDEKQGSRNDTVIKSNPKNYSDDDSAGVAKKVKSPVGKIPQFPAGAGSLKDALKGVDRSKLSLKERAALKIFEKMPQKKQESLLQQVMNPQTIMNMKKEDKAKMLKQLDDAVKAGLIPKGQAEAMKSQMGLR